ncbi:MAG TPA: hypothetical protein VJT73_18295 [Polyangiaceae bacterium]|nr:hypothetical protein [Polyangiaceae bacterium]
MKRNEPRPLMHNLGDLAEKAQLWQRFREAAERSRPEWHERSWKEAHP